MRQASVFNYFVYNAKMPGHPDISRSQLIHGPYKLCPNKGCPLRIPSFGVFVNIGGNRHYSRECYVCGHSESYPFPEIKKKVVYLDQFVLSNILKLLDRQHLRHDVLMADDKWRTRWERMFVTLEQARQHQVMVCPDSFTHRNESLLHAVDFKLNQRMYEHYSDGKTLYRSVDIQRFQFNYHFECWLRGEEYAPAIDSNDVCQEDLHTWSVGLKLTIQMPPYPGEVEDLSASLQRTRESVQRLWQAWSNEATSFTDKIHEETGAIGRALLEAINHHQNRTVVAYERATQGLDFDANDIFPPPAMSTISDLIRIARTSGVAESDIASKINRYFSDTEALLQVPCVKISSFMYASLARRARQGQKKVPKSLTDVEFISSYLPCCDAMFVDVESSKMLTEPPRDLPERYLPNRYGTKIFSHNNEDEFIDYLEELIAAVPEKNLQVLADINEFGREPFWDLINDTRREDQDENDV